MIERNLIIDAISRHAPEDGTFECGLPGVTLIRWSRPILPMPVVYRPTMCIVAQGKKRAMLGSEVFIYDQSRYLVASVDLPVMGSVIEASVEKPYLCLQVDLDIKVLAELSVEFAEKPSQGTASTAGLMLHESDPGILHAAWRILSLLDKPDDIRALAPLATREILYRLLTGPDSGPVRRLLNSGSRLKQISRAIVWMRENFRENWSIEDAADVANMSRSAFHSNFKAITLLSPLEFRTQLRLQEARRLMLSEDLDAASAGFEVGYSSPSQFSREYRRAFGVPPSKDKTEQRYMHIPHFQVPSGASA
ncbi:AraC family transcriptional regulator [Rhizobium sp. G21]|uniref:AraC family transcriptional regulator n=1 Tax=Rhizobium sp. G21 TaxID=2758439 RepID=UPI001602B5AF|nr:AraC family transcriptional regulator [Rhizobium sp. G21]MBB1251192.1 AraC family transcriptional regulator [Rhizobium sp. G21]